MTLRRKTLFIIGITLACLIVFLYLTSSAVLINGFSEVEKQDTRKNVERVDRALSDKLEKMKTLNADWATWDDTYAFVQDANEDYITTNLYPEYFGKINVNLMFFINSSGGVVFSKAVDLQTMKEQPVSEDITELLSRHYYDNISGIIILPEGPMLITSRSILTSAGEGPSKGFLIWGRYLDSYEIQGLADITRLSINMQRFDDMKMPDDFFTVRNSFTEDVRTIVVPISELSVAGYTLVKDINGNPALILRVNMPRDIYNQGKIGVQYLFFSLIMVGVIFGLMSMWLLEKLVLSRLSRLNTDVMDISKSGDLSKQMVAEGKDELSNLADAINTMTGELKRHRDHLEELVEERTKELRTTNEQLRQEMIEREKAEDALKDSEERYRTIIEHSNELIWTLDIEGRFVFINKYAEKVSGYRSQDWIGKSFAPLLNEEDLPYNIEMFRKTLKGEPQQYEVSVNRQDGSVFILAVNSAPLYSKGQITGTVSFGRDITESKKAEVMQRKNERLAYESKAKSEFLANMSHELRTPLNSIIGFSELLKLMKTTGELSEKQEHYVDNVITSGKFLLELVNDILDLSKVESGKIVLVREKLSVPAVINETFNLIKERASKHNIKLKKELDPQLDFIDADGQRIKQILFNLLSNAVKFNKEGGLVTVSANKEGDMARLSVSDTGIGIKEENLEKLFQEFEQLDPGISREYGGTGLGLAISKRLVELHGGKISVESKYGEGSTFTFSIPVSWKAG